MLLHLKEEKHNCTFFFQLRRFNLPLRARSLIYCFRKYPKLDLENFQLIIALINAVNLFGIGCTSSRNPVPVPGAIVDPCTSTL